MKETTEEKLAYREAMSVTDILNCGASYAYPICPRCRISMNREYQAFCDRCGQKLSWKHFRMFIEL